VAGGVPNLGVPLDPLAGETSKSDRDHAVTSYVRSPSQHMSVATVLDCGLTTTRGGPFTNVAARRYYPAAELWPLDQIHAI
jgi:hypothetical protein